MASRRIYFFLDIKDSELLQPDQVAGPPCRQWSGPWVSSVSAGVRHSAGQTTLASFCLRTSVALNKLKYSAWSYATNGFHGNFAKLRSTSSQAPNSIRKVSLFQLTEYYNRRPEPKKGRTLVKAPFSPASPVCSAISVCAQRNMSTLIVTFVKLAQSKFGRCSVQVYSKLKAPFFDPQVQLVGQLQCAHSAIWVHWLLHSLSLRKASLARMLV